MQPVDWRLVKRDGWLYLARSDTMSSEPTLLTNLWRVGAASSLLCPDEVVPEGGWRTTVDSLTGQVEVRMSDAPWATPWRLGYLPGNRPADLVERTPVPPPRVRKGIEVRWWNGAWEKRLRGGWKAA